MKRYWWCLLASLLAASTASAQAALTIDQAVAMALERNLGLQRDRITLESKLRASQYSWNTWLPSATVSAGTLRSNNSAASFGDSWSGYGSLGLSLSVSPSVLESVNRIQLQYESGVITYKQAERELELAVRKAFYSLLLADGSVRLAEQNIVRAQKNLDETVQKYNAGLVPDIDVFSARVSREKLTPKLQSAQTARENSLDSFKLLLGVDLDQALSLSGSLGDSAKAIGPEPVAEAAKAGSGRETLGILALEKSLQIARSSKKVMELDSFLPSASVALSTKPTIGSWASGGSYSDSGSVSLALSLPLDTFIPGSSARVAIAGYEDSIKALESRLSEAKLTAGATAQSNLRSIQTAISSLKVLESTVELAQKTYDLTYQAYQRGLKALSDVESAAAALDGARVDVLSQAYTLMAAILDLENTLDIPFGTLAR